MLSLGVAADGKGVAEGPVLKLCGILLLILDALVNLFSFLHKLCKDGSNLITRRFSFSFSLFDNEGQIITDLGDKLGIHVLELKEGEVVLCHLVGIVQSPLARMLDGCFNVTCSSPPPKK